MWLQTYRYFLASISNRELKLIRFQETLYSENMRRKTLFSEVIQLVRRLIQTRLNISPTHGASHMINKIFAYLQTCYHLRQRFDFKHIIFTSSSNFWVKSFSTVKVAPTWLTVGRVLMISSMFTWPFVLGGGWRMRLGVWGWKPYVSIWEKLTAACWQEHVNMIMVSRWVSCSKLVTEEGKPWPLSCPSEGYPLL